MEPGPEGVPQPGEVLGGKYAVERFIAEGGMGVVLEAKHVRLGHKVAIKVLHPYARKVPDIARRFEREARAAAQIRSAHVARVIDVESMPDGSPYMVMELLEGRDLGAELEARGPLPPAEAVGYALEACAAMAVAHGLGIVHRDLKPSNLFLAVEGGQTTLKVLDFGISKLTADTDNKMTATNSVLGTPLYMSPEQVRSSKNVDTRTDVWSLGVILYELLSGQLPFLGETATAVAAAIVADDAVPLADRCPALPPGLADVVMKALSKKPEARYQDVDALADALEPFASPESRARVHVSVPPADRASKEDVSGHAATVAVTPTGDARPAAPEGVGKTAPGWEGGVQPSSPPPSAKPRRALLAAALVVGAGALVGVVRSFFSNDARTAAPAAPPLVTAAPSVPAPPSAQAEPPPPKVEPAPTAVASASAPPAGPSAAPAVPVKHAGPKPHAAPSSAPAAPHPAAPPPVGLPTHL